MARIVKSSKPRETTTINTEQNGQPDMVRSYWPYQKGISKRRSHRHQWRNFESICMLILSIQRLIDARLSYCNAFENVFTV